MSGWTLEKAAALPAGGSTHPVLCVCLGGGGSVLPVVALPLPYKMNH